MTQVQTRPVAAKAPPAAIVRAPATDEQDQYLIFTLHDEAFAMGILAIREIIEYGSLTEVPMMPKAVRGVINLRGAVVPVIDLGARFGHERTAVGRRTCTVIVEMEQDAERQDVGIIVDTVNEVIEIPRGEIEPPPAFGAMIRSDFIAGMGKVAGSFVIILDVERILCLDELASISGIADLRETAVPAA